MTTQELKQQIDKVLGNSIRCLLPSYWWKRLFNAVIDKVDEKVEKSELKTINGEAIFGKGDIRIEYEDIEKVTYAELLSLISFEKLVPTKYYRITDYVTKACGGNVASKELKFDILVQAATSGTLYEEARALRTEIGDNLPSGVHPEGWKIKYTVDNNFRKHPWAKIGYDKGCIVKVLNGDFAEYEYITYYKLSNSYSGTLVWNGYNYSGVLINMPVTLVQGDATTNDYIAYKYSDYASEYRLYKITSVTNTEIEYNDGWGGKGTVVWSDTDGCYKAGDRPVEKATLVSDAVVGTEIIALHGGYYCSSGIIAELTDNDSTKGTGVIYEMEDEFGNAAPYDFKNLMFKRYKLIGNLITYAGYKAPDPYIKKPNCDVPNWTSGDIFAVDPNDFKFITTFALNDSQAINDMSLEGNIKNCKLGRECYNNVFIGGLDDGYILAGHGCKYNTLEVSEGYNFIVGNNSCFNITKTESHGNSYVGDNCKHNILHLKNSRIGDNCKDNYFDLTNTEIGSDCGYNYFYLNSSTVQNDVNRCYVGYSHSALFERDLNSIKIRSHNANNYTIKTNNHFIEITGNPKNFCINEGTNKEYESDGGGSTISLSIPSDNDYPLVIGKNSNGEVKMWNPADLDISYVDSAIAEAITNTINTPV
jgi:hypothetical protein